MGVKDKGLTEKKEKPMYICVMVSILAMCDWMIHHKNSCELLNDISQNRLQIGTKRRSNFPSSFPCHVDSVNINLPNV